MGPGNVMHAEQMRLHGHNSSALLVPFAVWHKSNNLAQRYLHRHRLEERAEVFRYCQQNL